MVGLKRAAVLLKRCLPHHQQTSSFHTNFVNTGILRVAKTTPHIASSLQQTATTASNSTSSAATAVRARIIQFLTGHFPVLALVTPSARPVEQHVYRSMRYGKIIHGLNFASKPFAKIPFRAYGRPTLSGIGPATTSLNASRSFTSAPAFAKPVIKKAALAFRQQASRMRPLANLTHTSSEVERNSSEQRTLKVRRGVVCETQNSKRFNPIRRRAGQMKRKPISRECESPVSTLPASLDESVCETNEADVLIIPRVCAAFSDIVPRSEDDQLVQVFMSLLLYGPVPWDDAVQCMSTSKPFSGDLTPTALSVSVVRNIADVVDLQTFHLRTVTRILQRISDCAGDGNAFRVERHGCELRVLFPRGCPMDRVRRGLIAMGIEPDSAHFTLETEEVAAELRNNVWKDMQGSQLEKREDSPEVETWRNIDIDQTGAGKGGFDSPNYLKGVNDFLTSVDEMDSVHFEGMRLLTYSRAALALNNAHSVDEFTNEWQ